MLTLCIKYKLAALAISSHLRSLFITFICSRLIMNYQREIYYLVTLLVRASFLRILQGVDWLYSLYLRCRARQGRKKRQPLAYSITFALNHFLYLPIAGNWSGFQVLWQTIILTLNLVLILLGEPKLHHFARRAGTFSLANYILLLAGPRSRLLCGVFGLPPALYRPFHLSVAISSAILALLHLFLLWAQRGVHIVSRVHAVTVSLPVQTTVM